ncbi:MAG: 2-hydroxyacyl-CoA dehydratase [Clostridia bacterium]|nr:2-hydroxyacyl-CoA dehydratase [Clostridia bacterium]
MKEKTYVEFTKDMKKDYTIFIPNMLPYHFELISQVMKNYGYNTVLLKNSGPAVIQTGVKYVHNDTCYPAILVIGQFINAIQTSGCDPHKVALVYFQTGGGCRASNYISLLRKALKKAGYEYIPVISMSFSGLETHSGFKMTVPFIVKAMTAILYGDLLMSLVNQCSPYEVRKGESEELAHRFTKKIAADLKTIGLSSGLMKKQYLEVLNAFAAIERTDEKKVKVGVVGEIYVKFSPLGNNGLVDFLVNEGAEAKVPGLLDFFLYSVYDNIMDYRLYGIHRLRHYGARIAFDYLAKKQADLIGIIREHGVFEPPTPIRHTISLVEDYIGMGTKMGEGWLLPAEMLELYDSGVKNIVCTQPFGCLPNHICGKGMMKPLKDRNPDMNIVAIDYDPGATKVNQENRLKLMLANARSVSTDDDGEARPMTPEKEPAVI